MSEAMSHPVRFSVEEQQAAVDRSRQDRDRTLVAMRELEEALAAPAPGREKAWGTRVVESLRNLESALLALLNNGQQDRHLWADIALIGPHAKRRVNQLHHQLQDLCRQASSLRLQLEQALEGTPDYADFRRRLAWLLAAIRHYRDQEADLIYEVYNVDIGMLD